MKEKTSWTCSICGKRCTGYGNNPYPVTKGEEDRCCDECNSKYVIPKRIYRLMHKEDEDEK